MKRREFLRMTAGLAAAAGVVQCQTLLKGERRPNVLFIMTDEQHYRSLSATGNPYIETPNMDRLAREGALFENATCVTPYCSPSRASILTGVYPHTHDILLNVTPGRNSQPPLPYDAFPNTETTLHEGGYATGHRGKWHLGDKGDFPCYESWDYAARTRQIASDYLAEHVPAGQFKEEKGEQGEEEEKEERKNRDKRRKGAYLGRPVEMIPAIRKGWQAFHDIPKNRVAYIATIGRSVIPPEHLPETQITDQVLDLIDENADEPFMITASWSPPHDLWVIPEPYYSMVDRDAIKLEGTTDLPEWDEGRPSKRLGDIMGPEGIREYAAIYHGMVKYIDDQLGRILDRLDEHGLTDNTLVIFTSDHGDMVGAHGCIGKSIHSFFDDLARIPLLMRLPGRIEPGAVVKQPVSQIDFMPTILDYAGFPVPEGIHGQSMRPLIEGRDVPWRDYAFCQRAAGSRMLRTERYKYTYGLHPKMVALYDLKQDPLEDHNLASDPGHADQVRAMHRRLLQAMKQDGDPLINQFPEEPLV